MGTDDKTELVQPVISSACWYVIKYSSFFLLILPLLVVIDLIFIAVIRVSKCIIYIRALALTLGEAMAFRDLLG